MAQFRYTEGKLRKKCLFQFEISCVKTCHAMCFKGNNNSGRRLHTSEDDIFHDGNSIFYTAYAIGGILLKVFNVFRGEPAFAESKQVQKTETPKQDETQNGNQQKIQDSNRSKDRKIELIN